MALKSEEKYPLDPSGYERLEQVGEGVSASVFRAICKPLNKIVAIKVLDLERCNSNLDDIRREAQTMSLIDHPNVVRAYCSFVVEHHLWVVMPYMGGGSCLHIMKAAYPDGFEEIVIASILREVLKALKYLHGEGHIHRDVKAGNILVDANGAVKLADFGVAACMFDTGDRQRSRNTFVGTPCWMAPEVMEQLNGYDFKADIWSFGITALELAHGHAPFSKYTPLKVFLMTLNNAPPGLDYERDKKFSKSFREMISMCLVKNPSKRPSAEKLLKHSFFKQAKSNGYIAHAILHGLPPLVDRVHILKLKEEDRLAQKQTSYGTEEEKSQNEYKRGISAWNFDLQELKAQAELIKDADEFINANDKLEHQDSSNVCKENLPTDVLLPTLSPQLPAKNEGKGKNDRKDVDDTVEMQAEEIPAFPHRILDGLKGQFDLCEHGTSQELSNSNSEPKPSIGEFRVQNGAAPQISESIDHYRDKQPLFNLRRKCHSNPLISSVSRDSLTENCVGSSSSSYNVDEKSKKPPVQLKGRFKVMADNADAEATVPSGLQKKKSFKNTSQPVPMHNKSSGNTDSSSINVTEILPLLQNLLQENLLQKEKIDYLTRVCHGEPLTAEAAARYFPAENVGLTMDMPNRESELLIQIAELESRISICDAELQKWKLKNYQMEQTLNAKNTKEDAKSISEKFD